jgi:quinol monooxygenase YgiN
MIKRIVQMTFAEEHLAEFLEMFTEVHAKIRAFPGCQHLELWRDVAEPSRLFTYSYWKEEADLESYRHSALFKSTWAKTKPLFKERAKAWSVEVLVSGDGD